jgi:hypothetical protein
LGAALGALLLPLLSHLPAVAQLLGILQPAKLALLTATQLAAVSLQGFEPVEPAFGILQPAFLARRVALLPIEVAQFAPFGAAQIAPAQLLLQVLAALLCGLAGAIDLLLDSLLPRVLTFLAGILPLFLTFLPRILPLLTGLLR